MRVYRLMDRWLGSRSFAGKLALICLAGGQLPVAFLVMVALTRPAGQGDPWLISAIVGLLLVNVAAFCIVRRVASAMVAPIRDSSAALRNYIDHGMLPVLPTHFTDEAGRLMAHVQHTIRALDIATHELRRLASLDPLTSLHNRRWLVERGQEEVVRARREGRPLAVVLLDLDFFKAINDRHGHSAGDAALVAVAEAMRAHLRSYDILARLGGEEFCVVLPDTELEAAQEIAERLRGAIADCRIPQLDGDHCTASIGVAALRPEDAGFLAFVSRADDMLYEAKKTGRDRVVAAA